MATGRLIAASTKVSPLEFNWKETAEKSTGSRVIYANRVRALRRSHPGYVVQSRDDSSASSISKIYRNRISVSVALKARTLRARKQAAISIEVLSENRL